MGPRVDWRGLGSSAATASAARSDLHRPRCRCRGVAEKIGEDAGDDAAGQAANGSDADIKRAHGRSRGARGAIFGKHSTMADGRNSGKGDATSAYGA